MLWLPTGFSWRELWESRLISGVNWRSSVPDGKLLTMTNFGAVPAKRSTSEGVQFSGVATSHVTFVDPYDGAAGNDLWISLRFKLDVNHTTGDDLKILLGKWDDIDNRLLIYLNSADGKLYIYTEEVGAEEYIFSAEESWEAGVWYHVLAIFSSVGGNNNGQRLIIDGGTPVINAAYNQNMTLTADIYIGNDRAAGTDGFKGVIQDVFMRDDTLTGAEETDLYNGIPPLDATTAFKFNEGSGSTTYDDGAGADDGTLGALATWAWDEVQQPVASFTGIDQYAVSASTGKISGETTIVWVGKIKSTYDDSGISRISRLMSGWIDNDNRWYLAHFNGSGDGVYLFIEGNTELDILSNNGAYTIDDYVILIAPLRLTTCEYYRNGVFSDSGTNGVMSGALTAEFTLGASNTPGEYDPSGCIIAGLIEGALNAEQVRAVTKHISDRLGLGVI